MKGLVSQLIENNLNDYKIVLVPHEDLLKKIMDTRKEFAEQYKIEQPIISFPEITLVTFKQLTIAEPRIINRLKVVAMGRPQIKIEIKDFGSFPAHTVFLNVTTKVPLNELSKTIRQETQRLMKVDPENKPHFLNDYYIAIGRKLKPWQYEQSWLEYSHKHFTARFIASKMLLLKKKHGEFRYKPIGSFEFENLPIETKQGELFQ
jgi:2'-5' RNA ligase